MTQDTTNSGDIRSKSLANNEKISPVDRKKYNFTTLLAKNLLKSKKKNSETKNMTSTVTL